MYIPINRLLFTGSSSFNGLLVSIETHTCFKWLNMCYISKEKDIADLKQGKAGLSAMPHLPNKTTWQHWKNIEQVSSKYIYTFS